MPSCPCVRICAHVSASVSMCPHLCPCLCFRVLPASPSARRLELLFARAGDTSIARGLFPQQGCFPRTQPATNPLSFRLHLPFPSLLLPLVPAFPCPELRCHLASRPREGAGKGLPGKSALLLPLGAMLPTNTRSPPPPRD